MTALWPKLLEETQMNAAATPPQALSEFEAVLLESEGSAQLLRFAAARLGFSDADTALQFKEGLIPFLVLASTNADAIPSPSIGVLIDLVKEHGTEEMKALLPVPITADIPEPVLFRMFRATCVLFASMFGAQSAQKHMSSAGSSDDDGPTYGEIQEERARNYKRATF